MKNQAWGCPAEECAHYTARFTADKPALDGRLESGPWVSALRSPRFVDLVSGRPGILDTRVSVLWDSDNLYVAYWVEEPNVQAAMTERDSFIYNENDVELFIAGEDCYYEFEINALGTVYEVFYIWQDAYRRGSRFDIPEFDLLSGNVDMLGGFQDPMRHLKHPRGRRWAFMNWDFPGLRSAVFVDGRLNDPDHIDNGWRVELAFPWKGMTALAGNRSLPPRDGDIWRMDFSRFEKFEYCGVKARPHPGWALNRHGVYDSHIPECFSYIHFSTE